LCLTETWIKHTTTCTELAHCNLLTILFSVSHVLSIGLTLTLKPPLATLPFLFVNLSYNYHPPKTASRPLQCHQLLSSYLASKYLFSMSIAPLQVPTTPNQTLFFSMSLILSYHLPPLYTSQINHHRRFQYSRR